MALGLRLFLLGTGIKLIYACVCIYYVTRDLIGLI